MAESASESTNLDVDEKLEPCQNDPGPRLKEYWKHKNKQRSKVVSVDEGEGQGKGDAFEKESEGDEDWGGTERYEDEDHEGEDKCEGNCCARRAELDGGEECEEVEKHEGEDQEGENLWWEEACKDYYRLKWEGSLKKARKEKSPFPDYLQEIPNEEEEKKKQQPIDDDPAEEDDVPACIKEILFCSKSMNVCQRQISCRHLLDMLRTLHKTPEYVEHLFQIIDNLSDDREACVVAELIELVVPIARFCYENEHLRYLIADRLVPLVLRFLMAPDLQVRVNTQECLRILRLEELIDQELVKRYICPVLINLTYSTESSPEYYSNAITLMTKMLPVIGQEATEEFFVPRIISLSMDSVMMVRKMCVANFGEYCSAVSTQVTENVLLPYFIRSCYDCTWEVRKSCAEVIMSVSCACRLETRKSTLAPVCAALLSDNDRSVRMAAFETLGPFITTFAEPSITGLAYNQHGQLVLTNWSGFEFRTTPKDDERCRMFEEMCGELNDEYSSSLVNLIENNDNNSSNSSNNITTNNFCDLVLEDYSDSNNTGGDVTCTFENSKLRSIDDEDSNKEVDQLSNDLGAAKLFSEFVTENNSLSVNKLSNHNSEKISNSNERVTSGKCDTPAFQNSELRDNKNLVKNNVDENTNVQESLNSLNENRNKSDNHNNIVNNYNNNNNNNYSDNFTNNKTVIDDNDNELGLQQYNTFLYWRDPLPVLDDLELPIPVSNSSRFFDNSSFLSSSSSSSSTCSSSSVSDDENKNSCTVNQDQTKDANNKNNINSNVPSNSSTQSSVRKNNSNDLSTGVKKIPIFRGSGKKDDTSSPPMMEMLMLQMYDRLYSEFNNDITYKPIPVLPFSDSSAVRQNLGLYKGLGLCRKKPCEKPRQNIVPQELIDHFVSLSDPVQGNRIDNRFLVYQIAYSLPAVAQTLGKENWPMLKNVFEKLAGDKTWKVRRAVASSIHELAAIVGQDAATQDLIPVFNDIIRDLDEVRIGALKHLASFLKTLRPAGRNSFLPKLSEFLMMDCDVNWRFREELAQQLLQMVGLFSTTDTYTHLVPLAILLLLDKVAAVRQVALSLVTELVRWISSDARLLHSILVELAEQFAHSTRWNRRQTFALLCSKLVCQNVLPDESFAVNVLPHLLDLSWDTVPNVRLAVARTLSADIAHHSYYADPQSPHHEVVMQTLRRLQADKDRDVQYLAFSGPTSVY